MSGADLEKHYFYFSDFTALLVITILSASIAHFLFNNWRIIKLGWKLPGPPAYPIFGNALTLVCKPDEVLKRAVDLVTPYSDASPMRIWMGSTLYVVLTKPHDFEIILNCSQAINKGGAYKFFYPFIGDGLISGSGKTWKLHRKIISRLINPQIINGFIETFDRCSKDLVKNLIPMANGETFDILSYVEKCTLNMVCETVMGCSGISQLNYSYHEFIYHTTNMYKIMLSRTTNILLHCDWIYRMTFYSTMQRQSQKCIRNFTQQSINSRREAISEKKTGSSILDRLLKVNNEVNGLNEEELNNEIYTVYIAAQDTLTIISSFAILMLGSHTNVQDKARAEVDEVFDGEDIDTESLSKLQYIEMIIKETLRLFPIAPMLIRQLDNDVKLKNCTLPKGIQVLMFFYASYRSFEFWDKPDQFIPERFTTEENSKRHAYSFVPFSAGPMGCIGQKYAVIALKTILANIIKKYVISTNITLSNVKLITDISIRSKDGYKISLKPR